MVAYHKPQVSLFSIETDAACCNSVGSCETQQVMGILRGDVPDAGGIWGQIFSTCLRAQCYVDPSG
jgi:hypothetical protein